MPTDPEVEEEVERLVKDLFVRSRQIHLWRQSMADLVRPLVADRMRLDALAEHDLVICRASETEWFCARFIPVLTSATQNQWHDYPIAATPRAAIDAAAEESDDEPEPPA